MSPTDLVERLRHDVVQLRRMQNLTAMCRPETGVRVKSPDLLIADLEGALSEIERLEKNVNRLTANPADHRYWEGRFRDEEKARLTIEAETREACAALVQNFTWTLPLYAPEENINVAVGEAANIVIGQLATAIRAAGKEQP